MTTEFAYLVWTGILTMLIRIPWMFQKVALRGVAKVSGFPTDSEPLSGWAHRVWVAHEDAVQNLVVFAILIAGLHVLGESSAWTQAAAAAYFWARLAHFVVYALGVPIAKSVAFAVGYGAQLLLAWQLITGM
jgi:uncharacterized MAPEG superfamily protein